MLKIFSYLKNSKAMVLTIILLLVVQAGCDLSLPQYTSDIVDEMCIRDRTRDFEWPTGWPERSSQTG